MIERCTECNVLRDLLREVWTVALGVSKASGFYVIWVRKKGPWGGIGELRTKVLVQVGKDLVFLKLLCVRHIPEGGPARKLCTPV